MPDLTGLPFGDTADFEAAERGLIDAGDPVIRNEAGAVVWDNGSYRSFLAGDAPDTVHPSLWRQSTLVARQGLFEVTGGIYQVRGYDLSNMSIIEGDTGIIVIDPLISAETAAAALALYRKHRGARPVAAVIHTHSHVDHFGGVKGVVSQDDVDAGKVQIIAPEGFMEHAIAENVSRGPRGGVGAGLGQTTSTGTVTLISPTVTITTTGQELTVDGVRMIFQMAPGTEAPAEMHFYFPGSRALCMAENATHTLHNLLTLRGALVRDPHVWAHYLTEAIELFAGQSDVVFASHHWPTWGTENITGFLAVQRDLYAYLHDTCWPTCSSSSATARRTAPGAVSSCPPPRNCGPGTSAPPPPPHRRTSSPTSARRCCSTRSPSRSTGPKPGTWTWPSAGTSPATAPTAPPCTTAS
jgi:alkyl sulfatase BDS1-like metallo-beta-lactamase superfamily hydrolase